MTPRIEIVAIGARTPLGASAASSAAAVRAGISRCSEYPFATRRGTPLIAAADPRIDPMAKGVARLEPLLTSALDEVASSSANGSSLDGALHLLLALPEVRPGFAEHDAARLVDAAQAWLRRSGARAVVRVAGRGHAGALLAVEEAASLIAERPQALCWVAGVDSYLHDETLLWLEAERRCAQPGIRAGFIPGEGAGCLALAGPDLRRRLRLPSLALVRGVGTAHEPCGHDSEAGTFGVGMTAAIEGAAKSLHLPDECVDALYTDINGERHRSEEWGFAALRTPGLWRSLEYDAPADRWGDVGAAFGSLAVILGVQSFRRSYARGPCAMIIAGSDAGLRGALLIQRSEAAT